MEEEKDYLLMNLRSARDIMTKIICDDKYMLKDRELLREARYNIKKVISSIKPRKIKRKHKWKKTK